MQAAFFRSSLFLQVRLNFTTQTHWTPPFIQPFLFLMERRFFPHKRIFLRRRIFPLFIKQLSEIEIFPGWTLFFYVFFFSSIPFPSRSLAPIIFYNSSTSQPPPSADSLLWNYSFLRPLGSFPLLWNLFLRELVVSLLPHDFPTYIPFFPPGSSLFSKIEVFPLSAFTLPSGHLYVPLLPKRAAVRAPSPVKIPAWIGSWQVLLLEPAHEE